MAVQSDQEIEKLIESELHKISDETIVDSMKTNLIKPAMQTRNWEYGGSGESFVCWKIFEHKKSDTEIVYSEFGFGPKNPWGLVSSKNNFFGMDNAWYTSLLDAYCDSYLSSYLKIWKIAEILPSGETKIIFDSLTKNEAREKFNKLPRPKTMEQIMNLDEYLINNSEYELLHNS